MNDFNFSIHFNESMKMKCRSISFVYLFVLFRLFVCFVCLHREPEINDKNSPRVCVCMCMAIPGKTTTIQEENETTK